MPPKKKYLFGNFGAKPRKKNPYKGKGRDSNAKTRITIPRRMGTPIPDSLVTTMVYGDLKEFAAGIAGTPNSLIFRANGVFDSDFSGVGHQAMGFDQWANFYNHICVLKSTIKITFISADAGAPGQQIVSIKVMDDSTADATPYTTVLEHSKIKFAVTGSMYGNGGKTNLSHSYNSAQFFDCDVRDREDLKSLFTTNPAEQAYYHVTRQGCNNSTAPGVLSCIIQIKYTVLLTERKILPQS